MINKFKSHSLLLNFYSKSFPENQSFFITKFFLLTNKIGSFLFSSLLLTYIQKVFHKYSLKSKIIPIFFISLIFGMGYDMQFLTTLSTTGMGAMLEQTLFNIIFIFLLLPLAVILFFEYKRKRFVIYGFEVFLLLFLIISEVSVISTVNTHASMLWFIKLLRGLFIYLIFSRIMLNQKEKTSIILAFSATIVIEFLLSFFQFMRGGFIGIPLIEGVNRILRPNQILINSADWQYFRSVGTFPYPNILGAYIVLILPLMVVFSFSRKKLLKFISYFSIIFGLTTLLLTLSRWGLVIGFFSIAITFLLLIAFRYLNFKNFVAFIKPYAVISSFIILILIFQSSTRERFLSLPENDRSLLSRTELLSESFYIIKNNPFGVGGGTFQNYFINYDITETNLSNRFIAPVHNFYLLLASETGIFGFLLFLIFIFEVTKFSIKKIRKLDNKEKLLALGFFASFITFLFHGLWESRGLGDRSGLSFWVNLGLLINFINAKSKHE